MELILIIELKAAIWKFKLCLSIQASVEKRQVVDLFRSYLKFMAIVLDKLSIIIIWNKATLISVRNRRYSYQKCLNYCKYKHQIRLNQHLPHLKIVAPLVYSQNI